MSASEWIFTVGMGVMSAIAYYYQRAYHKLVDDLIEAVNNAGIKDDNSSEA